MTAKERDESKKNEHPSDAGPPSESSGDVIRDYREAAVDVVGKEGADAIDDRLRELKLMKQARRVKAVKGAK